ncbi:MAG: hypothetical protein HYY55_04660 [Candidatus Niyogibacteria bacterium]|nr:MAG: hypothetical protein HYY55_04660 [Candidatus Niyogibacteria bacterium]
MGQSFLKKLREMISPLYANLGGHEPDHCQRMLKMFPEISSLIPGVDEDEFKAAVWLHSLDRAIKISKETLAVVLNGFLAGSEFSESSKKAVVSAILEHSKFKDGENDSPLLQALRLADKWDRIGFLGVVSGFMFLGTKMPMYHAEKPFGYGPTAEGEKGYQTIYENFYRVLEWYPIFPLLRELVRRHTKRFQNFLDCIRLFGEEVSEAHGVPNTVEEDIKRCLGGFYNEWKPL